MDDRHPGKRLKMFELPQTDSKEVKLEGSISRKIDRCANSFMELTQPNLVVRLAGSQQAR
jgi:hypothetical protein